MTTSSAKELAGELAAPSSGLAPGPYVLRMRRLVVVTAATAAVVAEFFAAPSMPVVPPIRTALAQIHQPPWAVTLALLLPPLIAGGAAAIGLAGPATHPGSDEGRAPVPSRGARAAAADRVWRAVLPAVLIGYAALVLLAAGHPLPPAGGAPDAVPVPNPLTCYYPAAAVAATAVLPTRGRFAYVAALPLPLTWTYPAHSGYPAQSPLEEVLVCLAFNLGTMGVLAWLQQQAAALDESGARRRTLVARLRIDESRSRAQREADNFVHDHILSVLKSVPTVPATSPQLRRSAREALASLHGSPESAAKACTCADLFSALSGRLRAIGGDGVVVSSSIDRDPPVPRSVAQAFEGAAAEALRNSLAHAAGTTPERGASDGVTRTATLRSGPDGVVVTISDDGRGFDPDRTPLDRHGITGSIVARMHDVGGTARIDAAPGAGTTVTLTWTDRARRRPSRSPPTRARDAPPARRRPRPRRCPCRRAWRPQSRGSSPCACSPSAPTSFSWRCGRDPTDGPRRSSGDSAPCRLPRSSCSGHGRSSACRAGRPHGRRSSSARRIRPSCSRSMSRGGPAAPRGAPVRGRPCAAGSWRGIGSGRRGPASDSSWPPPASGPWRRAGTRP